jgi:hypothetical protein
VVLGGAHFVGPQALQQVVTDVQNPLMWSEELVGWDTTHKTVGF